MDPSPGHKNTVISCTENIVFTSKSSMATTSDQQEKLQVSHNRCTQRIWCPNPGHFALSNSVPLAIVVTVFRRAAWRYQPPKPRQREHKVRVTKLFASCVYGPWVPREKNSWNGGQKDSGNDQEESGRAHEKTHDSTSRLYRPQTLLVLAQHWVFFFS